MKRKVDYTIGDILYSKRRPLTTRFWVPPDREQAVKAQFKRLMNLSHSYKVIDLPIHGDMVAFVDNEIRKQYDPACVRAEIDDTTAYFDQDWVKTKIAKFSAIEINDIVSNINHHKSRIQSFTTSIEDMSLDITSWQADLANLTATADKRVERAKSLSNQISEIRADDCWEVLSACDQNIIFCNKYPFVLTEISTGNMLQLGHWILKVPLNGRWEEIRLIPFSLNVKYDSYCHPNVNSNGFPCYGESRDKIAECMKLFRLLDITRFFTAFMTEYTHYQPFITFQTFYESGKLYSDWLVNELIDTHENAYISSNYREITDVLSRNTHYLAIRAIYLLDLDKNFRPEGAQAMLYYKDAHPDDCEYIAEDEPDQEFSGDEIEDEGQEGLSEDEIAEAEPFIGHIDEPLTEDELALRPTRIEGLGTFIHTGEQS